MGEEAAVLPKKVTQRPIERNEHERWTFLKIVRSLNPYRLVFVDETSTQLGLQRTYAYGPVGARVHTDFLRNFGPNRTLISALSLDGVLPSFLLEGGVTKAAFEYYLEHILVPALRRDQVVVLDNFTAHHSPKVTELVEAAGCEVLYLPSYSPDLNPIEHMFSKLKAYLRMVAAWTFSALSMAVKEALDAVSLPDIQGFFSTLGFPRQEL